MGGTFSLCGSCNLDVNQIENHEKDINRMNDEIKRLREKYDDLNKHMLINMNKDIGSLKEDFREIKTSIKYIEKNIDTQH